MHFDLITICCRFFLQKYFWWIEIRAYLYSMLLVDFIHTQRTYLCCGPLYALESLDTNNCRETAWIVGRGALFAFHWPNLHSNCMQYFLPILGKAWWAFLFSFQALLCLQQGSRVRPSICAWACGQKTTAFSCPFACQLYDIWEGFLWQAII